MAPRPDYEKANHSSSDEDCAQLVKPGQLNSFNQTRNEVIRQRLRQLEQMYEERRRVKPIVNENKPVRKGFWTQIVDYEDTQNVKVGDRVIVKEKYHGVCRYVGPIRETYATPEIFVGVELDERLTQNNGQFGSQTYFNCAMGYGLMVPLEKVRQLEFDQQSKAETRSIHSIDSTNSVEDERSRKLERALSIKRSKSVADLSRQVKTTNWMSSPEVKRRVSPGFLSLSRSKSISNLAMDRKEMDHIDPRAILDQVKRLQPQMNGEFSSNKFQDGYSGGPPAFGYASSHIEDNSSTTENTLRQSFTRIVNVQQKPQYSSDPLPMPFSYAKSRMSESFSDNRSEFSFSGESDMFGRHSNFGTSRSQSIVSGYGMSEYMPQKQPMCATCAACTTCGPARRNLTMSYAQPSYLGQLEHQQKAEMAHYQANQERMRKLYENQQRKMHLSRHDFSSSASSVGSSIDEKPAGADQEYEKWKSRHGAQMGRSMKRGLSRLQSAFQ